MFAHVVENFKVYYDILCFKNKSWNVNCKVCVKKVNTENSIMSCRLIVQLNLNLKRLNSHLEWFSWSNLHWSQIIHEILCLLNDVLKAGHYFKYDTVLKWYFTLMAEWKPKQNMLCQKDFVSELESEMWFMGKQCFKVGARISLNLNA